MNEWDIFLRMGVALAIGVLIGVERGWHERDLPEGRRVAGVRTFALLGLLGASLSLVGSGFGGLVLGLGLLAVAVVLLVARLRGEAETKDIGVTTIAAGLLTYALGAVAMKGELGLAVSAAVVATFLLGAKPELHGVIARMEREELMAALKLLAMSFVLLPVLPDRGLGPWDALNPFDIWLMVVLICSLSFLGYVGTKALGERKGVTLAALAGGLVSSTAVTISLSRIRGPGRAQLRFVGGAIALASAVMYGRTLIVVLVFGQPLLAGLGLPLSLAALFGGGAALLLMGKAGKSTAQEQLDLRNPFDIWMALQFGLLLALVTVLARAMKEWVGDTGVLLVSGVAGLVDVDAATLSVARMAPDQLPIDVGVIAVWLAVVANTVFKAAIAIVNSRRKLLRPAVLGFGAQLLALAAGILLAYVTRIIGWS